MEGTISETSTPRTKRNACVGCHDVKTRCVEIALDPHTCARCSRLKQDCLPRELGVRGRRHKQEDSVSSARAVPVPAALSENGMHNAYSSEASTSRIPTPAARIPPPLPFSERRSQDRPNAVTPTSRKDKASHLARGDNEPALSLQEAADLAAETANSTVRTPAPPQRRITEPRYSDPVDINLLSLIEAEQLFECFHDHLNPLIKIVDRKFHTASKTRLWSPVLFSAMLAVSARFYRRDLYNSLLSYSHQLIGRAMVETMSHIGVIQAICITVYWKEPNDRSAWMRIGWAIRLGFQLKLPAKRSGPLPSEELEARVILDRERTWLNVTCFDTSYRLDQDYMNSPLLPMPDSAAVKRWSHESASWGCPDDIYLAASIDVGKIRRLTQALERSHSPLATPTLYLHIRELCDSLYHTYYDSGSSPHRIAPTLASSSFFISYRSISVDLAKAKLIASNFDETDLVVFSAKVSELVETLEEAAQLEGFMETLQDATATTLFFKLGEFLSKLYLSSSSGVIQQSIIKWLTQIYNLCSKSAETQCNGAPAYIAKFYQLLFRLVSSHHHSLSGRPSRASSIGDGHEEISAASVPNNDGLLDYTLVMNELFPGVEVESHDWALPADSTLYWENSFPGVSAESLAWLDSAQLNL